MFDLQNFIGGCRAIRSSSPLVLNITNYVAMNVTANALLAIGASPIMSFCPDEMVDLMSTSDSLAVNLGCLDSQIVKASKIASASAVQFKKKWVLDPVGAGASALRGRVSADLAEHYGPSVIRGNASEIISLASEMGLASGDVPERRCKGADSSSDSLDALEAADALSRATGAVISVSGPIDIISGQGRCVRIENGSPLMPKVTALGCTATAITAAFLAIETDPFRAAVNAMALMGCCGELAEKQSNGTGTFAVAFMDALSGFNPECAASIVRYSED